MASLHLAHFARTLRTLLLSLALAWFAPLAQAQLTDSPLSARSAPTLSAEMQQAMEWLEVRSLTRAQALIEQELSRNPRSPIWRFLQASLSAELGQDEAAIRALEDFTGEFPELAEPFNNLAVLYLRVGQPQKALAALERALVNRPGYALAYENLGDLYASLALRAYGRGLSSDQPSALMRTKQAHLQNLPQAAPLRLTPRLTLTERNRP
jgi:predicted Zn-dependent protease